MSDQPNACDECLAKGHYCPGHVTADDGRTHLCFACDEGVPCGHQPRQKGRNEAIVAPVAAQVEKLAGAHTAKASLKAARLLGRGKEKNPMRKGKKLSDEVVKGIEAALAEKPGTELAIARRFGVGYSTVCSIRLRMKSNSTTQGAALPPPIELPPPEIAVPPAIAAEPPPAAPQAAHVTFARLTPAAHPKYAAFQAVICELSRENESLEAQIATNRTLIQQLTKIAGRYAVHAPQAPQPGE